jgi:hypothetical protein
LTNSILFTKLKESISGAGISEDEIKKIIKTDKYQIEEEL